MNNKYENEIRSAVERFEALLCGQLEKDSGEIWIAGADREPIGNILGVIFQNSVLDQALTVKDNLKCQNKSTFGL